MLKDKVVIVTGAGGGIGREMALEMGRLGAKVVVNDLGTSLTGEGTSTAPAQQVVNEIIAAGGSAVANTDSVATWDSAQAIVATAIDSFGRVDGIVNNAGILRDRFFVNMDPEEWRLVIDVHLNGSFYVSRAAAPIFKAQNTGAYVHMVSTTGLIGTFGQSNYGAAKLGMAALSKCLGMEMARYNVRSNCIAPFAFSRRISSIPTETDEQKARVERLKVMDPAKVAPLAAYLLSDTAADVSGQIFSVRANEIFLMSQCRPVRSMHTSEGWTAETIANHAMPAFRGSFYPLDRSQDVFTWDPV